MQTRIPEMKTSIERLQERLDDMFFKDATPTSIRSTVSGENYAVHDKTGDKVPKSLTSSGIKKNKDRLKTVTNYRDNLSQKREKKHIRFQTNAPSFNSSAGSEINAASHSKAVIGKERSSGTRDKIGFVKQTNTGLTNLHTITNSKITSTRLSSENDENTTVEARGFDKNHKESRIEVITDSHMDSRFKKKVVYARSEIVDSILAEPRMRNIESEDKPELHARVGKTPKANERISKESNLIKSSVSKETEDLLRFDYREAEEPSRFSNSDLPHHNTHASYSAITPVIRTDTIEKQRHSSNAPHNTKEAYSLFTPVIRSDTLKSVSSSSKSPRHRSRKSPKLLGNIVYNPDFPQLSQNLNELDFVKASPEFNHSKVELGDRDIVDCQNAQSFSRSELELNHSKVELRDNDIAYGKNAQSYSRSELELNHSKVKLGARDIANGKNAESFSRSDLELNHSKVKLGGRDIAYGKNAESFSRSELELNHSKIKVGGRGIANSKKAQSFSRSELELNHSKVTLGDMDILNGKNAQCFNRSELELNHSKIKFGDGDIVDSKKPQSFCRSELDLDTEDLYDDGSEHVNTGNAGLDRQEKSHIVNIDKSGSDKCFCFECGPVCVCGETVISSVSPAALREVKTPQSFDLSECSMVKHSNVLDPENLINSNKTSLGDNHKALRMAKTPQSFDLSECNMVKDTSVLVPDNSINSNKICLGDRNSWGESGEVQVLEMAPKPSKQSVTSLSFCTSRLKEMSDKSASQLNTSAPPNLHIGLGGYIETPLGTSSLQCEKDAVLDSGISNDTQDRSSSSEFSGRSFMDWLTLTKAKAKDDVSPRKFEGLLRSANNEVSPRKFDVLLRSAKGEVSPRKFDGLLRSAKDEVSPRKFDGLLRSAKGEVSPRKFDSLLRLAKDEVSPRKFDGLLRSEELLPEKLNYEMMGDCDDIDSVITISSTKTDGTYDVVSLSDSQLGCSYEDKAPKVTRHTPYVHVREKQQAIAASPKRVRFNLTS